MLLRNEPDHRGKGYARPRLQLEPGSELADAVVVVDADTAVSTNLLTAFAARFEAGAVAVQADYGVRNPPPMAHAGDDYRTRRHGVRSVARERLGLSCGLRGNGMGFSKAAARTTA